jgi:cyclohexanone monooxygenase
VRDGVCRGGLSGQIEVTGENGMTLRECWRDGAYAYLGMSVPGFPNFFMLEAQAHYVVRALRHMRRTRKSYLAVRVRTMTDFIAQIDEWMQGTVWTTRCHNYFRAPNGRVSPSGRVAHGCSGV